MTESLTLSALDSVKHYGQLEDESYRTKILSRHPSFSRYMSRKYDSIANKPAFEVRGGKDIEIAGYVAANRWLYKFEQSLKVGGTGLFCDCEDETIVEYAKAKAKKTHLEFLAGVKRLEHIHDTCGDLASEYQHPGEWAWDYVQAVVEKAGIELTIKKQSDPEKKKDAKIAAIMRTFEAKWWVKKIRTKARRQFEQLARKLGLVCEKRGLYVSSFTYSRRIQQKHRNNQLLLNIEAVNGEGYCTTLADIADAGVSNPVNRRNELMVRFRGYDEAAKAIGYVGLGVTLTAPSK